MNVEATTAGPLETRADTCVIGVLQGKTISHDLPGGELQALVDTGEAKATLEHTALVHAGGKRWVLVGLGDRTELTAERMRRAAAAAQERARQAGATTLAWEVPHKVDDAVIAAIIEGTVLADYRFERFKSFDGPRLETLVVSAHHDVSGPVTRAAVIAAAQNRARDLGNTPANHLGPLELADYTRERFAGLAGAEVTVHDEAHIRELGMGAFAAVAQGSARSACLIRIDYAGPGAPAETLALVGKAVTFDTGGISLKPAAAMEDMKFDMLGGAAVIEAIAALAELQAPVRVLGLIGATENMPSGKATRPGDIVHALDGTTIEVNNTDAEGRLVLADLIAYARQHDAARIVDIATLTGGIVIALGSVYAGLFSNHDELRTQITRAGETTGELAWPMPVHPDYRKMIEGRYAQLTNRSFKREALAQAGSEFLRHFAGETPWAHIDIAGVAYDNGRRPTPQKGAVGFGVRLLVQLATGG